MPNERQPIQQSAVLAYRIRKKKMQFALVTSLDTGRWVIPKGHIESGLSAHASAEKEAFEEAGLFGSVSKDEIGQYSYKKAELKGGGDCLVQVYPMRVRRSVSNWPEKALRRRKWMSPNKAAAAVIEPELSKLILRFSDQAQF
ncbi:MAG: NUDIX hydrolase [Alphaproteobacteria bacterium]